MVSVYIISDCNRQIVCYVLHVNASKFEEDNRDENLAVNFNCRYNDFV